jgi:hypothetical protein
MTKSILICILLIAGTTGEAQTPPWKWSVEDRARLRGDVEQRRARNQRHEERNATIEHRAPIATFDESDLIEGSTNPELFFPTELFRQLVKSAFISNPTIYPQVVRDRTSDLFTRTEDWQYFATIVDDYATLLQREVQLGQLAAQAPGSDRARISNQLAAVQREQCRAMKSALTSARGKFGRDRFDRMLYEVVPPGLLISYGDPDNQLKEVLRQERDCQ